MQTETSSPSHSTSTQPTKTLEYRRPWLAAYQRTALFTDHRYAVVEGSTKSGKTAPCLIWLAEQTMAGRDGQNFWWVAPVYTQAEIAFRRMKRGLPRWLMKTHDSDRWIRLVDPVSGALGATMWFKSAEKPDNLFGEDVFAAVVDEASRVREDSWHALLSTLTATDGHCRIIGNVKGRANWFYRLAREAERATRAGSDNMTYSKITACDAIEAGLLKPEVIEDRRQRLPEAVFNELYMAVPGDTEGRVYREFAPENITSEVEDLGGTLLVGMDFNVDPMSAVLGSKAGDELHVWDEIAIINGNTEMMAAEIRHRYPGRDIAAYPDPSGNSRRTSAPVGQTDHTILGQHGMRVYAPKMAPPVVDRINEVNALCKAADGRRRLFVHPRCEHLIDGLEGLVYKDGTSQPDKSLGIDHHPDALGYLVHSEFPIVKPVRLVTKRLQGF